MWIKTYKKNIDIPKMLCCLINEWKKFYFVQEFAQVCASSTDFHFPTLQKQLDNIQQHLPHAAKVRLQRQADENDTDPTSSSDAKVCFSLLLIDSRADMPTATALAVLSSATSSTTSHFFLLLSVKSTDCCFETVYHKKNAQR